MNDSTFWDDAELKIKRTNPSFGADAKVNFNHQNETLKYSGERDFIVNWVKIY